MRKSQSTSLSLALLAGFAVTAAAQGGGQQPRLVFQAIDTDRDGTLSAEEIKAAPTSLLVLDKNGDGVLTFEELSNRPDNAGAPPSELTRQLMSFDKTGKGYLVPADVPDRMQGLFTRADADHDGKITPAEINALSARQGMPAGPSAPGSAGGIFRMDPVISALDTNHDGILSAQEIAAASKSLLALDRNGDGQLTPDETRVRQQTPEDRAIHMLDEWDTDKDGKLSRAEAPERMAADFSKIDKDGDGYLSKSELTDYFASQPVQGARPADGGQPQGPRS